MSEAESKYWLDQFAAQVEETYPVGEILVASGVSASGSYHIGHFREVLTADAIAWALRQRGRQARHLYFVDDFDPLRRRYPFLPDEYEQYVGWPLCMIPDPEGCHGSYSMHFAKEFEGAAAKMGVRMEGVFSYSDQYRNGRMVPYIEKALEKTQVIRQILREVSNRELPEHWMPVQIMDETKTYRWWPYVSHDTATKILRYRRPDDSVGEIRYDDGQVKLNWRLDWVARWAMWGVKVEPFGKEHASRGGSYDTGVRLIREVFEMEPPVPLPFDTINLIGETKKMSSSLGNLVTAAEALKIMPPEIIRYFVLKSVPKRVLYFDPSLGLYNLIDEFSKLEDEVLAGGEPVFKHAYGVATAIGGHRTIARIPFSHLVAVEQTAAAAEDFGSGAKEAQIIRILNNTGYEKAVSEQWEVIERELEYVRYWLEKYAPASVKFAVRPDLPEVDLSDGQQAFLAALADAVEAGVAGGQAMHEAIYEASQSAGIKPGEAFKTLYLLILGQDHGPKAGWFLASLDQKWLAGRLRGAN
jgi:lysyl-tRNA synthetase class 1